jgi:type II secretory pathway component GspD/PulD (secretin)
MISLSSIRSIIVCVFVVMTSFHAHAQSNDLLTRKTTLQVNSIKLGQALDLVAAAYGVQFSFSSSVVPIQTLVSVNIKDNNLEEALTALLHPLGIKYHLSGDRVILSRVR